MTCKDCKYFKTLVDGLTSYGQCDWFLYNNSPHIPIWATTINVYGSISPKTIGCKVFEERKGNE